MPKILPNPPAKAAFLDPPLNSALSERHYFLLRGPTAKTRSKQRSIVLNALRAAPKPQSIDELIQTCTKNGYLDTISVDIRDSIKFHLKILVAKGLAGYVEQNESF